MARGIERRKLFCDNHDGDDFLRRVAALTDAGALAVRLGSNLCAASKAVCLAGESLWDANVPLRRVLPWELPICPGSYIRL